MESGSSDRTLVLVLLCTVALHVLVGCAWIRETRELLDQAEAERAAYRAELVEYLEARQSTESLGKLTEDEAIELIALLSTALVEGRGCEVTVREVMPDDGARGALDDTTGS